MAEGYLTSYSNESMPGLLKVIMTVGIPDTSLGQANTSDTWRPPTPYKLEFAKKVSNANDKLNTLHDVLEEYTENNEFFRVSLEKVRMLFDLMDGEMLVETHDVEVTPSSVTVCRDMAKCFTNGQRIRHTITGFSSRIGTYNSSINKIEYNGENYTLNKFVVSHYKADRPDRGPSSNAWKRCKCEVGGQWISTYNLPVLG